MSVARLAEQLARGRVLVLTGAGVSTSSGIPDYRDEDGAWKHKKPVEFREFTGREHTRRRYWSRSFVGWPWMRGARPNAAHYALAALERKGLLSLLVTQNVDGLHQSAGSRAVVDLHGRLDRVVCLSCGEISDRDALQSELARLNPAYDGGAARVAPDGDAEVAAEEAERFRVANCRECGGLLKPDVVFFGENVPSVRVERVMAELERAHSLLVVGSSLMVFSGYRFARAAARLGTPLFVVNRGRTRADDLATAKIEADAGTTLNALLTAL